MKNINAGIPFKLYMIGGDTHSETQLNIFNPAVSLQQVALTQFTENITRAERKVAFCYQHDGVWVGTGVQAMQLAS